MPELCQEEGGFRPPASKWVEGEDVRSELERLLHSDLFASTRQLSKLLRYLVDETLAGRGEQLDAYSIAINALEKRQSFDPSLDTIVRSTLRRLRQRLEQYYSSTGKNDLVDIRIPVRSYIPQFRRREEGRDQGQPTSGETISHYRIIEKIGEDGMGTVYLAHDLRLQRAVALKFLPNHGGGEESWERIVREAQVAATIDHPNLCSVYEIFEKHGRRFIVGPYAQGEGLERKIALGRLSPLEALEICEQVALGLAAAHRKGVIHCGIKPSNVIVNGTEPGALMVKVIDFGIARARAFQDEEALPPAGTLAYMSPERILGELPGPEADLWSLGVVMYEMVAGRTPFGEGEANQVRQAILEEQPEPLTRVVSSVPAELESIVEKALVKEPNKRYRSADDLARDLNALRRKVIEGRTARIPVATRGDRRSWLRIWASAALFALLALAGGIIWVGPRRAGATSRPVFQFTVPTEGIVRAPAISPDGRYVAYVGTRGQGEPWKLIVHDLRRDERSVLADAVENSWPAWSPDSRQIAFWNPRMLLTIPRTGGPITEIYSAANGHHTGAVWSSNGKWIYFGMGRPRRLYQVPSIGGEPQRLGKDDFELDESPPFFLGGRDENPTLLYTIREEGQSKLVWHDFPHDQSSVIQTEAVQPVMTDDYLFYRLRTKSWPIGPLFASAITRNPFQVTGEHIRLDPSATWHSISKDGTLIFLQSSPEVGRPVWLDRSGRKVGDIGQPEQLLDHPQISKDGEWVALSALVDGEQDIWLHDSQRLVKRLLTRGENPVHPMGWTEKWAGLVYYEDRQSETAVLAETVNENSGPVEIYRSADALPEDVSSDGRYLLLRLPGEHGLAYVGLDERSETTKPIPLVQPRGNNYAAEFSPDGRYVAYASTETGESEIYIQTFPSGPNWVVSAGGGTQVRWNPNGHELFYVRDDALVSVPVRFQPSFSAGPARVLFRNPHLRNGYDEPIYDVFPDGQRFAVIETLENPRSEIRVISNILEAIGDLRN